MHEKKKEETDGLKEQERYDLLRDEMEQVKNFSIEQLAALCMDLEFHLQRSANRNSRKLYWMVREIQ